METIGSIGVLGSRAVGFRTSVWRALVVQVAALPKGDVPEATTVNPRKLETGLRPNSAGIPYTLLLRIEAMGFPTFGLLL